MTTDRQLVLVTWIDAAGTDGWRDPDELDSFGISKCRTVGYVMRDSGDELVLAQTLDDRHGNVCGLMAIPQVAVRSVEHLVVPDTDGETADVSGVHDGWGGTPRL